MTDSAGREPITLLGQAEAKRTLLQAWRSGRLHHGWLFTGPNGIGKATLARWFARVVLGEVDPQAIRRMASGTHADLLVIARSVDEKRARPRTEIVLEDVRPVADFLHRTAAGGWRVVVVDGAEHLNRHAANALLKLLEEPPSHALILLTCGAPGRLLPTIRSRCRLLRLRTLDEPTMHEALQRLLPALPRVERQTLIDLSDGSPGRALALAAEDGIVLSELVRGTLSQRDRPPGPWSYEVAEAVLRHENGFSTFIDLLSAAISTTMREAARDSTTGQNPGLLSSRSAESWAEACDTLARLRDEAEAFNLDKRQALLTGLGLLSG